MENIKKVPSLRFPEFSKEWEIKELGKIAIFLKGKGISKSDIEENGKVECIRYGELYTHYNEIIINIKSKTNLNKDDLVISKFNDVIIPASGETPLDIAKASCVLKDGVALSGDLNIIRTSLDGVFLSYYLNNRLKKDIASLSQGNSVVHLYSSQLKTLRLNVPEKKEQQKISEFLSKVDKKIEQLTKKKQLIEGYKKGVMQQIFNQEIRFKCDSGNEYPDWEEKKLGDVGENIIGLTYSPKDIDNENGIIVLRSSNIKDDNISFDDLVKVKTKLSDKLFIKNNDIVICTRNGSQRLIGKNIIIKDDSVSMTFGAFMSVFRSSQNNFIFHLFKTNDYYEQIQANLGARINQITNKTLNSFKFSFPCLEEQHKIANFLTEIDNKIIHISKQLNGIKKYKKGLLQQMFF